MYAVDSKTKTIHLFEGDTNSEELKEVLRVFKGYSLEMGGKHFFSSFNKEWDKEDDELWNNY